MIVQLALGTRLEYNGKVIGTIVEEYGTLHVLPDTGNHHQEMHEQKNARELRIARFLNENHLAATA